MAEMKLRRQLLIIFGAACGVLIILLLVAIAVQANNTVSVGVTNNSPGRIRLNSCVDDSLDFTAGQTFAIDVSQARVGCPVFGFDLHDFGLYEGCLILRSEDAGKPPVPIFGRVEKAIGENRCAATS